MILDSFHPNLTVIILQSNFTRVLNIFIKFGYLNHIEGEVNHYDIKTSRII